MLELNDGNCVLMGGEIHGWKEIWTRARERAQRERDLGVDPTIKALIWNPDTGGEEEVDEGESGERRCHGGGATTTSSASANFTGSATTAIATPTTYQCTQSVND